MDIREGMAWPPMGLLDWKMAEHSAWYSGDAELLANFYSYYMEQNMMNLPYPVKDRQSFWGRQIETQGEIFVHVPLASDIASTSADFLFGESPTIKIAQAHAEKAAQSYKDSQTALDKMLMENMFYSRILEGAEASAGIGGVYIKLGWDNEISEHPLPVIVQCDRAIPTFKFGILTEVIFWKVVREDQSGSKVYRLLECYRKGAINYELYLGTSDHLGKKIDLKALDETKDLQDVTTVDELLAVYIPNVLPNRLDRNSYLGRSDYAGIEGLMDSLDEVFSCWVREIALAQPKIFVPDQYLAKVGSTKKFNLDKMLYVKLDADPVSLPGKDMITPNQFEIRADQFEKSALNFLERAVTSAGYSPQSFGLNIQGRAESGTALGIRERKSFATKGKKQNYWQAALKRIVTLMMLVSNEELEGKFDVDVDINVEFNDGITNDTNETSNAVKLISDAQAASIETKVRMLHKDWDEDQIKAEIEAIKKENNVGGMPPPDGLPDLNQIKELNKDKEGKEEPAPGEGGGIQGDEQ